MVVALLLVEAIMSAPSDTPKWLGEQPQIPVREQDPSNAAFSSAEVHQDEWKVSEHASWNEPSEKVSSEEGEDRRGAEDRLAWIFVVVLVVATSAIFSRRRYGNARCSVQISLQALKPPDRLTGNGAPANSSVVIAKKIATSQDRNQSQTR